MSRIFISYKRVDQEKVFKIKNQIESALGEKCWIDIDGIESDAVFASKIISAIKNCEVFLFMYSKGHNEITDYENDWTIRELNLAQKKKKRIVFINIDGCELSDWFELLFGNKQQVNGQSVDSINRLIQDLMKWLNMQNAADFPRNECRDLCWLVQKSVEAEKKEIGVKQCNGKFYFYDKKNDAVLKECIYDTVQKFQGGNAVVWLNGKVGVINSDLHEIIPCEFDDISIEYAKLLIHVNRDDNKDETFLWNGVRLIPGIAFSNDISYSQLGEYLHPVGDLDDDYNLISGIFDIMSQKLIIPCEYLFAAPDFYYKIIRIRKEENSMGCVDVNCNVIIPFEYDEICNFCPSGLAKAVKNGKIGYIDIFNNVVIPFEYDDGTLFQGRIAYCKKGGVWYQVDRERNVKPTLYDNVRDPQYHEYEFPDSSPIIPFFFVEMNGKVGTVDVNGNVLIPCTSSISGTLYPNCILDNDTGEYLDPMGHPISSEMRRRIKTCEDFYAEPRFLLDKMEK